MRQGNLNTNKHAKSGRPTNVGVFGNGNGIGNIVDVDTQLTSKYSKPC